MINQENVEISKEDIENTLKALASSFEAEHKRKHLEEINSLKESIRQNVKDYDISQIQYHLTRGLEFTYDIVLKEVIEEEIGTCDKMSIIQSIIIDLNDYYKLIESFLDFCKDGLFCMHDKSSFLLRSYIKYALTNKVPDMEIDEKCYWKPYFGTWEEWKSLIESYYYIHNGYIKELDNFLIAYSKLAEKAIEKRNKENLEDG